MGQLEGEEPFPKLFQCKDKKCCYCSELLIDHIYIKMPIMLFMISHLTIAERTWEAHNAETRV